MDVYALVYLVSGSGRYRDENGAEHRLGAGSVVVVFPGLEHDYGPGPGESWTERYILFDGALPRLLEERGILDRSRPVGNLSPVEAWLPLVAGVTDPVPGGARCALIEWSRLQVLLAAVHAGAGEKTTESSSWFEEACLLLAHEPALHLTGVAAAVGLPYERFRKRFAEIAGESPGRWRNRRRMDEAARMLQQGGWTIRAIARELGFYDEYAFSRRFKEVFGVPPSRFRADLPKVRSHPRPSE
nr:AraC family transcriptional regulator [Phytoactinopolyspora mesophila]